MKHCISMILVCSFMGVGVCFGQNLLRNPSFESDDGWLANESASLKNRWRHHDEGACNAAIEGLWATKGLHGFIEQSDIPVEAGERYVFRGWLWADISWRPVEQYAKIAFLDDAGEIVIEKEFPLSRVFPEWVEFQFNMAAPEGSTRASVIIGARSVSTHGALTIDDLFFGKVDAHD